jgi:hypothetical protein
MERNQCAREFVSELMVLEVRLKESDQPTITHTWRYSWSIDARFNDKQYRTKGKKKRRRFQYVACVMKDCKKKQLPSGGPP